MNNIVRNKSVLSKALTGASVVALVFALNVSGAFAGFWRIASEANPTQFLYGWGSNAMDQDSGTYSYGYGYGYGNGDFNAGYATGTVSSSSSSGGSGGGGGGGGGGSAGVGLPIYDASTGETTSGIDSPTVDTDNSGENGEGSTSTSPFSDVDNNWAKDYIIKLFDLGIVSGYDDGEFKPENNITRAEFLKIALRAFGHQYSEADGSSETFADVVDGTWVSNAVGKAQQLGIVDGYGAAMWHPNAYITRAEAMKILILSSGLTVSTATTSSFGDVTEAWQVKYIETALANDIITAATNFRPADSITRAEVAKVAVRGITAAAQ